MTDKPACEEYSPWRKAKHPLQMDECEFYAHLSGHCHCVHSPNDLKPCVYKNTDGVPNEN
jgi:hypothetical protein